MARLSILTTVFGSAGKDEAEKQLLGSLAYGSAEQKAAFAKAHQLPTAWGDEVPAQGISIGFAAAADTPSRSRTPAAAAARPAPRPLGLEHRRPGCDPSPRSNSQGREQHTDRQKQRETHDHPPHPYASPVSPDPSQAGHRNNARTVTQSSRRAQRVSERAAVGSKGTQPASGK